MTTDLKTLSPAVPAISLSTSSSSSSFLSNKNGNNLPILSKPITSNNNNNNNNKSTSHTFTLRDLNEKSFTFKNHNQNDIKMTGSSHTNSSSTNNNDNNCGNISLSIKNTNLEMANNNCYNGINNSFSNSNSNSVTTMEMMNAIEELRRENERITNELGATQDMLDLFEHYRDLLRKLMDICICAGKDHLYNQWKRYETDYKNLIPIKRLNNFVINENNNLFNNNSNDKKSTKSINESSSVILNSNFIGKKFFPIKYEPNKLNGNVKRVNEFQNFFDKKFDVTLKKVNEDNNNNHSQGRGRKSLVGSFLDGIRPVNFSSLNHYHSNLNTKKSFHHHYYNHQMKNHYHYQSQQQPINIVSTPQSSNILFRKRSSFNNEFSFKNNTMIKRMRQDLSLAKHVEMNIINKKKNLSADNDVERLDKLNNALDQILLGRYDALTSFENNDSNHTFTDDNDDMEITNNNDNVHSHLSNEDDDGDDDEEEEEEDEDGDDCKTTENHQFNNNDMNDIKYESDSDQDDVIILDTNNQKNDDKEQKETELITTQASSNILSTVLKSGLKPYNNFQMNNNNSNVNSGKITISNTDNKNGISNNNNGGTIKLYPVPLKITNSVVPVKENSNGTFVLNRPSDQQQQIINNTRRSISPSQQLSSSSICFHKRPHLTNEERSDIINRLKSNESGARIARDYGITKQAVSAIKRRAQLMGDNFHNKYYYSPNLNGNNNLTNSNNNSSSDQQTSIIINVTPSSNAFDNSLVSRQLKQQKVNATIMKQSNLLAKLPRSTSDLVLPVNPVAIIKSKMAAQKQQQEQQQQMNKINQDNNTNFNNKIDSKRLILPRLLQGTDTYTPKYVNTVSVNDHNLNDKPTEKENHKSELIENVDNDKEDTVNQTEQQNFEENSNEDEEEVDQDEDTSSSTSFKQQTNDNDKIYDGGNFQTDYIEISSDDESGVDGENNENDQNSNENQEFDDDQNLNENNNENDYRDQEEIYQDTVDTYDDNNNNERNVEVSNENHNQISHKEHYGNDENETNTKELKLDNLHQQRQQKHQSLVNKDSSFEESESLPSFSNGDNSIELMEFI